jgi:hemerythrin-like domain-containing protein
MMAGTIAELMEIASNGSDAAREEIRRRLERYEQLSHEHGNLEAEVVRLMAEVEAQRKK